MTINMYLAAAVLLALPMGSMAQYQEQRSSILGSTRLEACDAAKQQAEGLLELAASASNIHIESATCDCEETGSSGLPWRCEATVMFIETSAVGFEGKLTRSQRRQVQSALAAQGVNPGPADGIFGERTRTAIKAWQASRGYAVTGELTDEQARLLVEGEQRSAAPAPAAAQQEDLFGSIAVSSESVRAIPAWAIAWNHGSLDAARSESLAGCTEYGGTNCAELGWFRNQCGALAVSHDGGGGAGTGGGRDTAAAEAEALAQCRSAGNANCRIAGSACVDDGMQAAGGGESPNEALAAAERAASEDLWGSIMFSQESGGGTAWGMAWNAGSIDAARSEALAGCQSEGGTNCAELGRFRNQCGALAVSNKGGAGTGAGRDTAAAEAEALEQCHAAGEETCRIVGSACVDDGMQAAGVGEPVASSAVWCCIDVPERGFCECQLRPGCDAAIQKGVVASCPTYAGCVTDGLNVCMCVNAEIRQASKSYWRQRGFREPASCDAGGVSVP